MNSPKNDCDAFSHGDECSLHEIGDFLAEVREVTRSSAQAGLHEFACLLGQVLDLHANTDRGTADYRATAEFISESLTEIRTVLGEDLSTSERMEGLREVAIDRWCHVLSTDEIGFSGASPHDGDAWNMPHDDLSDDDTDFVTPSADEISSLLSQFGQSPTVPSDEATTCVVDSPSDRDSNGTQQDHQLAQPNPPSDSAAITIESLDPELREAFLDDAASCVSSMEAALLMLESDPQHTESVNQICRELHTLKGASGSVGLSELADQLHGLEDRLRNDMEAGRSPGIDELLKNVDSIRSQILGQDEKPPSSLPTDSRDIDHDPQRNSMQTPTPKNYAFDEGSGDDESVRVQSSQLNRLMDMLAELVMLRNRRETEFSDLQEVHRELIGSVSKMRMLSKEAHIESAVTGSLQLSEIANDVLEVAQHVRDCARPIAEGNIAVSLFIRQFRQELVELRRTPISGLFRRLQRVVRDAAKAESKEVRFQLLGEEAGIERSLQQRLYEPLLHIVRNSVCHGIELGEQRKQCGKDPVGTITLEAKAGPDLFVIEIRDDGGGLNYDAIRRRAVESGLLAANQAASRQELSQMIFHPGFSTRQTANQVAGRGVGMDVVASTLKRMRGWLEVDSEPKQGTRIRLSFPLPSVIQHVMVFRCAEQLFALPMQSVQSAGVVDKNLTSFAFSDLLGYRKERSTEPCQRIVLACDAPESRSDASENGRSRVALLVDEIVGPEEVVVRPLPALLKHHPFCSSATLSGMGQIVLLLDARRVLESRNLQRTDDPGVASNKLFDRPSDVDKSGETRPRVLVVDDSLSARKRVVRSLHRYPIDVVEASDGREAIAILKSHQFAAVFSDMEMPHVSGMELLAEINSGVRSNSPPVVIISSRHEDEFTHRAKQLGAFNYLVKPLTDNALDAAIAEIPSLRQLRTNSQTELQASGEIR